VLVGAAVALLGVAAPAGEQDRLRWLGATRHIAVLTPAGVGSNAPLLLVLGNPGRSARYALNSWRELAEREGLIVAAISSAEPEVWSSPEDGPGFLRAVVQRVAGRHEIDRRRVYLFGAGAGGGFALSMGLLQPSYFAAVASFGGDLEPGGPFGADGLERALPIYLYLVKRDPRVGIAALQQTAAALRQSGAEVEVEELGVGADFERRGRKVAERIWNALGPHSLSGEPRYRSSPSGR
jgi:poly(3-hydroxybutyrate) depolymerase